MSYLPPLLRFLFFAYIISSISFNHCDLPPPNAEFAKQPFTPVTFRQKRWSLSLSDPNDFLGVDTQGSGDFSN